MPTPGGPCSETTSGFFGLGCAETHSSAQCVGTQASGTPRRAHVGNVVTDGLNELCQSQVLSGNTAVNGEDACENTISIRACPKICVRR